MIAASPWALRPRCHVNIGVQKAVLCFSARLPGRTRRPLLTARDARSGNGDTKNGSESPLASVSDAVIGFFDDITRGSVSIDEDDAPEELKAAAAAADAAVAAMPPLASEAAAAAVAAADAAARAAAEAAGVSKAAGEWEGAAMAALAAAAAATSSHDGSTATKSLETYAAAAHQDLSIAGSGSSSSSSSSGGRGSGASKLQAQPAGSSGSGGGSSSSSSRSRQAVATEAAAGAGGELQAATLSLSAAAEDGAVAAGQVAAWALKGLVGVGLLQAFKCGVESAMQQLGVTTFPPAVASMLAVPLLLSAVGSQTADGMVQLFDSCVAPWTTDLLGLFYVPAVAILPVLLRGMQGPDLAGLLSVAVLSAAATLVLTAKAAAAWTPAQPATPAPAAAAAAGGYRLTSGPAAPVLLSLSFLAAAGPLALTRFDPVNFGAQMALPVGFAWSLMGFVAARVYLQQQQKKGGTPGWPSPVLAGAVAAKLGVAWHASIMGWGYRNALSLYYVGDVLGAGDVLAAPLGAALTAVGCLIYKHRAALALPAIAATAALSAAFSVATSVAAAKVLGVSTDWARAFIPRSVTDSTASHFARAIGAPSECTGLVVILQAAVTIFMGRLILKAVNGGKTGPAAAGTAVGSTAGLMGVAGVCGSNEVALANGAVAYAVMVAIGSFLSSVPTIASVLAAMVA